MEMMMVSHERGSIGRVGKKNMEENENAHRWKADIIPFDYRRSHTPAGNRTRNLSCLRREHPRCPTQQVLHPTTTNRLYTLRHKHAHSSTPHLQPPHPFNLISTVSTPAGRHPPNTSDAQNRRTKPALLAPISNSVVLPKYIAPCVREM